MRSDTGPLERGVDAFLKCCQARRLSEWGSRKRADKWEGRRRFMVSFPVSPHQVAYGKREQVGGWSK